MPLGVIQHLNIRCADAARTRDFYVDILGLTQGDRPPFASKGYWLYAGDQPVIHLVQRPDGEARLGPSTGDIDHVGFEGHDLAGMRALLKARDIPHREAFVPRDGMIQIFVRDPDGVMVELNFSPEEVAAAS